MMDKSLFIVLSVAIIFSFWGCEQPKEPNFKLDHKIQVPLSLDKTYQFLGAENALIDTTKEDFENIFATDEEGLVRVIKEQDFNFGNINDAIPEIDVPLRETVSITVPPTTGSQTITASGSSTINNDSFEFRASDHFVEMDGGELTIDITNSTDVSIDLEITFPEVRDPNTDGYPNESSSLVISIDDISPNSNSSISYDLANHRIYAGTDHEINYEITVTTNSSAQQGGDITTEVGFGNLGISRAEGYIVPRKVLLNEDATTDGIDNLDVFNDQEAEITDIDGISDLSERISDITFTDPILSTFYNTNLGVNTMIYAVIAGTNTNGEVDYLVGKDNSDYQVTDSEIPSELTVNGVPASEKQVIKFPLDIVDDPSPDQGESGSNEFNAQNSNTSDFFSNLPTTMRFIGVARVNDQEESGAVVSPVIFEPSLNVELPFNFSADNASFKDTLDADLSDLPGEDDNQELDEAMLTVNYTNQLPLDLDLSLDLLDPNGNVVVTKDGIGVDAATVNDNGFVESGAQNKAQISFSNAELQELNRTRNIELNITINTPGQQSVKLRKEDSITFRINMDASLTSTVN